jgi:iron complex outermembrane recepter protein
VCAPLPGPVRAAETEQSLEPAGAELEQVTVTAEKAVVDLQQAALAVTAIPSEALDRANIVDLSGLNGLVPGTTITKSGGYETIVTIRGVGSETPESEYTAQPGVSFNVDGVAIANTISLDQVLFDVDQIELLRGPQATIFGQASTGGAINMTTKQPVLGEFEGSGDISYGNYELLRLRNAINIPVGETVAVRASIQRLKHDGFARDSDLPDYRLDDANDYAAKVAVLWTPFDAFSATVTAQIYHANQNGAEQKNVLDPNAEPRVVSQDYPGNFRLDSEFYHANLRWSMPWGSLTSVSSLQYLRNSQQVDGSRSDFATLGFYDDIAA